MIMVLTIFGHESKPMDSIAFFLDYYYTSNLSFMASDLLRSGLTPNQISEAVDRAVTVGKASGLKLHQHFKPLFSGVDNEIIKDCRLSRLAYGLVLMNADIDLKVVGNFQLCLLQQYLNNK